MVFVATTISLSLIVILHTFQNPSITAFIIAFRKDFGLIEEMVIGNMIEVKMRVYDQINRCLIPDLRHDSQAGARVDDHLYTISDQERIAEGEPPLVLSCDYLDFPELIIFHDTWDNVSLSLHCLQEPLPRVTCKLEENWKVNAPGFIRAGCLRLPDMRAQQLRRHGPGADEPQRPRLCGGDRQLPAADPYHAGLDDGVVDVEQFRNSRFHP